MAAQEDQPSEKSLASLEIRNPLGPLEAEIMNVVWQREEATVRDVYKVLLSRREIAYTTVLSTMSNLAKKGMLVRRKKGKAHAYVPVTSKNEFTKSKVGEMIDKLLDVFSDSAGQHLVSRLNHLDPQKLARLEQLLAQRKRQIKMDRGKQG